MTIRKTKKKTPVRRKRREPEEVRAKRAEIKILHGMVKRERAQLADAEKTGTRWLVIACKNAIKDLEKRIALAEERIVRVKLAEKK